MKKRIEIIKIGGDILNHEDKLHEVLKLISQIKSSVILVHGGGKTATELAQQMGVESKMINGRRITSEAMLKIVVMTYAGTVNKTIVAKLQALHVNAIGLCGADGNLISSQKRPAKDHIDFGWVGDPHTVNTSLLNTLIEAHMLPVIAPLTHDKKGQLLNTNADTVVTKLAIAMNKRHEVSLSYCFDLPGVMERPTDKNSLIKRINEENYHSLQTSGAISDGMIPKLDHAFDAQRNGVKSVKILHFKQLKNIENKDFDECTTLC